MVAPHEAGDLVRSLVRVPGSGQDRTLESACLDLSKVSIAAAAVFVPRTLPPALARPQDQNQRSENLATKSNDTGRSNLPDPSAKNATGNRKRILKPEPEGTESNTALSAHGMNITPPPSKRRRLVYMTPEQVLSYCRWIRPVHASSGSLMISSSQQAHQHLNSTSTNPISVSVSQLLQERNALREENQVLQHQLLLFQQLMKNKERLASVVRRLGVQIPQS